MRSINLLLALLAAAFSLAGPLSLKAEAPSPSTANRQPFSQPDIDAPQLAALGPHAVGVRSIRLIEPAVPDVLNDDKTKGLSVKDRPLLLEVWYPALPSPKPRVIYHGALPSQAPGRSAAFSVNGIAVRDAPSDRHDIYPVVVMSHGYSGTPVAMSWLAENLASKGYVVVAAHHEDPQITDPSRFAGPLFMRPLDIAFIAHAIQARAKGDDPFFHGLVDPTHIALVGYSMGGYGVLTAAGAGLAPLLAAQVPGGAMTPYAMGGAKAEDLHIDGLRAVVAISPAGGGGAFTAWDATGLAKLRTPTLLIVGDQDKVVGYSPGVKTIFDEAVNAPRYLLVFKNGAHSIGMNGAPESMKSKLWDYDWFEDPVWRKGRVIGVNLHMITAFLDLYVKGEAAMAPYLDVTPSSNEGLWPQPPKDAPYGAYSPGSGEITVWKGFQRVHSAGLELHHLAPAAAP